MFIYKIWQYKKYNSVYLRLKPFYWPNSSKNDFFNFIFLNSRWRRAVLEPKSDPLFIWQSLDYSFGLLNFDKLVCSGLQLCLNSNIIQLMDLSVNSSLRSCLVRLAKYCRAALNKQTNKQNLLIKTTTTTTKLTLNSALSATHIIV